jgi:hypothetical protein
MSDSAAMNVGGDAGGQANPFSPRAVLALVLFGAAVFVALLYMIGAGMTQGSTNDGGAHVGGKGLNGYAGLAALLERQGYAVSRVQSESSLDEAGLLVLTPQHGTKGKEIAEVVNKRRRIGPTLIVTPKWFAVPINEKAGGKQGWVQLAGAGTPQWPGFLDNVGVKIGTVRQGRWVADGLSGVLPDPKRVESGFAGNVIPLVEAPREAGMLAGYVDDDGIYPQLDQIALRGRDFGSGDRGLYPVIVVFEPDLLDNYGLADKGNALLALKLIDASLAGSPRRVSFDLTFNGFKRSANLLTLAFTPPFLAATLCLLLAAVAIGWRAFNRFGPPQVAVRAIAFGKRALVTNTAGLIRRSGRRHLVAGPYAAMVRERLARTLALPRSADVAATEAAIDRALAARAPDAKPFSIAAAHLRAARRPAELLRSAQELHSLERKLTR